MKLSIARGALLDSLGVVTKALSARTTLPILSGILMSATKDGITLQSTDLEISIKDIISADVEDEGSVVVPGRLLADVVRKMPDAAIRIETVSSDKIQVSCRSEKAGAISFSLRTLSPDDFPRFPEVAADKTFDLPTPLLSSMVKQVSRAVSRDEARPILTGILVVMDGTEIRMVATDSYRLAIRNTQTETPVDERIEVVIPGKALEEIPKIAGAAPVVKMGVSENQIVFSFGGTTYVTRRIEGTFPNYRQLVPAEGETNIIIDRAELLEAVQRVSLMAQHNAPLRMKIADNTLTLSATTQDVGEASEDLMVEMDGQPLEIAFNHAFLIDGVNSSDDDKLSFMASSPLKPGVFKSTGTDAFVYLIMPVRP
ncbi:MAG: DNA polymerase III subunit beta [Coriobacteriia bacterium]|nr:DNA polymerase III subunit beta [Coriobacteriia bacterium]